MSSNNFLTLRNDNNRKYKSAFKISAKRKDDTGFYKTDTNFHRCQNIKHWKISRNYSRNTVVNSNDKIPKNDDKKTSSKRESYNKYLFHLYQPNKNYDYFRQKYNSLGKKK